MHGTLVFDGNCGFCTRSRNWLERLDRHRRIDLVPSQQPGLLDRLGLSAEQADQSVWWLGRDGSRLSGAAAVNHALSTALGIRLPVWLYRVPGVGRLQEAVYRWVANNRGRLRGTTPWCSQHPEQCVR